jgi:formyltetrahydrofolate deformylase
VDPSSSGAAPAAIDDATLATLLVSCGDRRGIVAALAQVLAGHGANILDSDQHTDRDAGQFFQRIRFDLAELTTDKLTLERAIAEVAARFKLKYRIEYGDRRQRLALFASNQEHCLVDLLLRHRAGELPGDVVLVISNHPQIGEIAAQYGIEFHALSKTPATKQAQEAKEVELLQRAGVDLIVLARYMQVLSPAFVRQFPERIINIHHSFLPAFVGGKPYHQARERGVKLVGATAHYATADLDEGPIIEQDVVRCSHRDTVPDLVRKGRDLEKVVLARAVRWHLEHRILVYGNKTVVFE